MKILFSLGLGFASSAWSLSLEDSFQAALGNEQLIWAGLLSVLAGFLTSLSPCVYPLIPVTLSIMGTRRVKSHWHGFTIASVYVLGMTLLYAFLGILFVSFGWLAGSTLQSPWMIGLVAFIFTLLSMSMFNAFEFAIPQSMMNRISRKGGEGYPGVFLMGLLSGVIAAPCTGPILTFILTLLAEEGNFLRGILLMMLFSFGLGIPFLVLGTFSSFIARLPKSGSWMNVVKTSFGIVMMSTAFYYLQFAWNTLYDFFVRLRTLGVPMLILLICVGLIMGAWQFSFKNRFNLSSLIQGCGVLIMVFSINGLAASLIVQDNLWTMVTKNDKSLARFQEKLNEAKKQKKPVVIDFYADWCVTCKKLDQHTYSDTDVKKALNRFALIKVDVTSDTKELGELRKRFGVIGLPTVLFIDSQGALQASPKIFSFIDAKAFLKHLELIK